MLHGVAKCEFIFCLFFLQLKKKKKATSIGGGGRGRGSPAGAWGRRTVGGDEQVERRGRDLLAPAADWLHFPATAREPRGARARGGARAEAEQCCGTGRGAG